MLNNAIFSKVVKRASEKEGLLVIISSPTAGGKTTVGKELVKRGRGQVVRSISATSRLPRKGEKEGRDYYFVGADFKKLVRKKYFLEWERVHDSFYGTPEKFVARQVARHKAIILTIDVKGGIAVKKKFKNSVLIFLLPPSLAVLQKRLQKRGTENKKDIDIRLNTAVKELSYMDKYDYLVINDHLTETIKTVESIIKAERQKIAKR